MGTFLRAEARPIDWNFQHETQREALLRLVAMLNEGVDAVAMQELAGDGYAGWLDERRSSRVAFLVGGRGTGKTSVMATLYKACRAADLKGDDTTNWPGAASKAVRILRSRLAWLEPLDAESVTDSTNLLAAILARVDSVCRGTVATKEPHSSLLSHEYHEPLRELQRLQMKIAVAWDNSIRDRRSPLDLSNMANESLQYEAAKLSLDKNINTVLDKLASSYHANGVSNPMFVLPVDDFDVNPSACVHLLKVLRLVSSSRLFFLVLGDIDVAEAVMSLHQSAELMRITRDIRHVEYISPGPERVAKVASELAASAIRKLIPPAQRVYLFKPRLVESLQFRPLGSSEDAPMLHELLDRFPVFFIDHKPGSQAAMTAMFRQTLRDYILTKGHPMVAPNDGTPSPATAPDHAMGDLTQCCYSARFLLLTSLRRISDIWHDCATLNLLRIYELQGEDCPGLLGRSQSRARRIASSNDPFSIDPVEIKIHDAIRTFLQESCRDLLSDESALSSGERMRLAESLRRSPNGSWYLGAVPLQITSQTEPGISILPSEAIAKARWWPEYSFRKVNGWQFAPTTNGEPIEARADWLSPALAGMLTLFHDFVVMGNWNRGIGSLVLDKASISSDWATTTWKRGLAVGSVSWPVPPCLSIFSLDRFVFCWNEFLRTVDMDVMLLPNGPMIAAFSWISIGTAAIDSEPPVIWSGKAADSDWVKLQRRLAGLASKKAQDKSFQSWRGRRWLCSVASFLMPEMGGFLDGMDWHKNASIGKVWEQERQFIVRQRVATLAKLSKHLGPEFVASICGVDLRSNPNSMFSVKPEWVAVLVNDMDANFDVEDNSAGGASGASTTGPGGSWGLPEFWALWSGAEIQAVHRVMDMMPDRKWGSSEDVRNVNRNLLAKLVKEWKSALAKAIKNPGADVSEVARLLSAKDSVSRFMAASFLARKPPDQGGGGIEEFEFI